MHMHGLSPVFYFKHSFANIEGVCRSTGCGCKTGFTRDGPNNTCVLCPVGVYCETCILGDLTCPTSGVHQKDCYDGATSPAGSWLVDQCYCVVPGRVTITDPFYGTTTCVLLPYGGLVVAGTIQCKTGYVPKNKSYAYTYTF